MTWLKKQLFCKQKEAKQDETRRKPNNERFDKGNLKQEAQTSKQTTKEEITTDKRQNIIFLIRDSKRRLEDKI